LIESEELRGPINICSPDPLPNGEFMRTLRRAWGAPIGLPATKWMLAIGAMVMGTETELILKSRRVIPTRLLQSGFGFRYPQWADAAAELCQRSRTARLAK
jgi:NAD dependent epimerase/dehydratase family enzyme